MGERWQRVIDSILDWADDYNCNDRGRHFDTSFVESLSRHLQTTGRLSERQRDSLTNIVTSWEIEVEIPTTVRRQRQVPIARSSTRTVPRVDYREPSLSPQPQRSMGNMFVTYSNVQGSVVNTWDVDSYFYQPGSVNPNDNINAIRSATLVRANEGDCPVCLDEKKELIYYPSHLMHGCCRECMGKILNDREYAPRCAVCRESFRS